MFPVEAEPFGEGFPASELDDILLFGNLPGVTLEGKETRIRTLESYVDIYLEEEIRREALVRNVGAFQQFLELAATESGSVINLANISRESGVPVATLRTYSGAGRHVCGIPYSGLRQCRAKAGVDNAPFSFLRQRGA